MIDVDELADEALRSLPATAPPSLENVRQQAAGRSRRRRLVSGAGVLGLSLALVAGGWWSLARIVNDQQGVDTVDSVDQPDGGEGDAGPVDPAVRGGFIWPFPARGIDNAQLLIEQFASEVLDWSGDEYDVDAQSSEPLETTLNLAFVTLTNKESGYPVVIVASPSPNGWGIVQIDSGDGTDIAGLSESMPLNMDLHIGRPVDDANLRVIVNLADGWKLDTALEPSDAGGYTVGAGADKISSFEDIVSLLIIVESGDEVVAVTGGQFNPGDEEEAMEDDAMESMAAMEDVEDVADEVAAENPLSGESASGAPSQTPEDAARDGVISELAELSFGRRIKPISAVETPEGSWFISRPEGVSIEDCVLGDGDGRYGPDFICTWDYTEILLLDPVEESIIKAYPMPSLHVYDLLVTDGAVYCRRVGDGGYPDSILCRIDRLTGEMTVRVFPFPETQGGEGPEWVLDIDYPYEVTIGREMDYIGGQLSFDGTALLTTDSTDPTSTYQVTFDPVTLEVLTVDDGAG